MIADIENLAEDTYLEKLDEQNIELMSKILLAYTTVCVGVFSRYNDLCCY